MVKVAFLNLKKWKDSVDWQLLIFLVLFLNIKMPAKIIAIVFIYLLQFNFKFGFKLKNSRLPLFYLLIIPIAIAGLIINQGYVNYTYMLVFLSGIGFWLLSILAIHQIKLAVERSETEKIHKTIIVFFIINAVISGFNLLLIMHRTGSINPYTFKGLHQTYYIMTGDYIGGLPFDISSTNAVISAFGVIYFLVKKVPLMLFVCMTNLLLTYSNLINLMLLFVLLLIFIFKSNKDQKSLIIACLMLFCIFMIKVSPQNKGYALEVIKKTLHIKNKVENKPAVSKVYITQRPDSTLTPEEKKEKIATLYLDSIGPIVAKRERRRELLLDKSIPVTNNGRVLITEPDSNSAYWQPVKAVSSDQKLLIGFIEKHKATLPISSRKSYETALPGKAMGLVQTVTYLYHHPDKIIAGAGIGNFSSKIAFRASGLGLRGHYPANYAYIYPAFQANHLDLYMNYFSRDVSLHSVSNNPFSVYDQMLSEYGLLGFTALIIFYFGFFAKKHKQLTYGIPLLLFVAGIFFIDYWFEQLSVLVLFELMLFLDLKENKESTEINNDTEVVEIPANKELVENFV
jgi:hypothetical protein